MLLNLPQLKNLRRTILADFGVPDEVIGHVGFTAQFDTRDTERALAGTGIEVPELASYADKIWDYWERNLDPDLFSDRSFEHAVNGKTVVITGASSGIGRAAALQDRPRQAASRILVARSLDKLEETKAEIEARRRHRLRLLRRPVGHGLDRRPRRADAQRPRGDRRARQQRRAARSAARWR